MTTHHIEPNETTLHGTYSRELTPVLRVNPGDTVISSTLDAGWGLEAPHLDGTERKIHPKLKEQPLPGHALVGPIWIEGAQPGHTLIVTFDEIVPGDYGYTFAGGFPHRVNEALGFVEGERHLLRYDLDVEAMTATNQQGHTIPMVPFLGNVGTAPAEDGYHSTAPPSPTGGNLDCKDLVAGTRLYLPIMAEGGLFSFGDGHAAQGHGEASVYAIECPMARVRLTLKLSDEMTLTAPRSWTPDGWITFGFAETLDDATMNALSAMVDFMVSEFGVASRQDALALASAVVDLHITQIANPLVGVHAVLPHGILAAS